MPERGSHARALLALGIHDYRQTVFKPRHVIYRVVGRQALIFLIVDGRRDLHGLLTQRLLGA
jgi:toxin ParE1/3/4